MCAVVFVPKQFENPILVTISKSSNIRICPNFKTNQTTNIIKRCQLVGIHKLGYLSQRLKCTIFLDEILRMCSSVHKTYNSILIFNVFIRIFAFLTGEMRLFVHKSHFPFANSSRCFAVNIAWHFTKLQDVKHYFMISEACNLYYYKLKKNY